MNKFAILSVVAAVAAVAFFSMAPSADSQVEAQFGSFLAEYGRSYNSQSEYDFRLNVFKKNLNRAAEMQKASTSAQFGVTQFSDWTEEEFKRLLGDNDSLDVDRCVYSPIDTSNVELSPVDLTKYFAPVQNQGSCGSCWSFATAATFEAYWNIKKGQLIKASEQFLVDCDTVMDSGCNGGLANNAYVYLGDHAFVTEKDYPYEARDSSCKASGKSTIGTTGGCHIVAKDEKSIYAQLQNGPVSISVDASNWSFYKGGIFEASQCGQATNHAVVVVGYGEEEGEGGKKDQYWIVRNSWGETYGEKGYIRLRYGKNACNITKRPGYPIIN